jgi:ADP-L-glycero-D-manno-heptose 6-epimerase
MASVAFHHYGQFQDRGAVKLFGEYGGYGPGEQTRDFVYIDDVVAVNLWFLEHPERSGVFNLGTGRAQTFNDVARASVNACRALRGQETLALEQLVGQQLIQYVEFPQALIGKYQCRTQADLGALRAAGCALPFVDVATGVERYVRWLAAAPT